MRKTDRSDPVNAVRELNRTCKASVQAAEGGGGDSDAPAGARLRGKPNRHTWARVPRPAALTPPDSAVPACIGLTARDPTPHAPVRVDAQAEGFLYPPLRPAPRDEFPPRALGTRASRAGRRLQAVSRGPEREGLDPSRGGGHSLCPAASFGEIRDGRSVSSVSWG